ncbi:pleckstrin homology domain-containing family N member 1 [Talpa occidentalis]|uniref:pleckstrin homology domain-containing family N member 1 n=1 Tax=Talpa occidentalis TaxID=50954 RepID=UPI00188F13ED|nr:pleckstrin homology domain-containing family N member 1 [Talpa occidentalis]
MGEPLPRPHRPNFACQGGGWRQQLASGVAGSRWEGPAPPGLVGDDGARRAGLFGAEAGPDGDSPADKLFYYIPGTDIPGLESQQESLEQPFLSVFKKGRRRVPVRNLGKVVYYAKVQLRFQHSQDISDCYLELFPAHLYFQAHGAEGLTFQGLLPLVELSVRPLEGPGEHGFQITGPLPAPLLVLCPGPAERSHWLYHLEKQMAVVRGLQRCHSAPPQRRLSGLRTAPGCQAAGSAICASRVQLQHLPAQEQWDRLLVLYPASLAIFSEEDDGLCFKVGLPRPPQEPPCVGELPLSAVSINLEEQEKQIRSFLIEGGPLINSIRVLCASYEDYGRWLLCLQAAARALRAPAPPGPQAPLSAQPWGGGRSSLSSDGHASWDSGCPAPPSAHASRSLPESSAVSAAGRAAVPAPDSPGCSSIGRQRTELRRGGSRRSPRGKAHAQGLGPAPPLHLDLTKLALEAGPEAPDGPPDTPRSPLYADPYTPPAMSHHKVSDVRGLDEFLVAMQSSLGPKPPIPCPLVPVSVPVSDPSSRLSQKGAPQPRASQWHQGSVKGRGPPSPDSSRLTHRPPQRGCGRALATGWTLRWSPRSHRTGPSWTLVRTGSKDQAWGRTGG